MRLLELWPRAAQNHPVFEHPLSVQLVAAPGTCTAIREAGAAAQHARQHHSTACTPAPQPTCQGWQPNAIRHRLAVCGQAGVVVGGLVLALLQPAHQQGRSGLHGQLGACGGVGPCAGNSQSAGQLLRMSASARQLYQGSSMGAGLRGAPLWHGRRVAAPMHRDASPRNLMHSSTGRSSNMRD